MIIAAHRAINIAMTVLNIYLCTSYVKHCAVLGDAGVRLDAYISWQLAQECAGYGAVNQDWSMKAFFHVPGVSGRVSIVRPRAR